MGRTEDWPPLLSLQTIWYRAQVDADSTESPNQSRRESAGAVHQDGFFVFNEVHQGVDSLSRMVAYQV